MVRAAVGFGFAGHMKNATIFGPMWSKTHWDVAAVMAGYQFTFGENPERALLHRVYVERLAGTQRAFCVPGDACASRQSSMIAIAYSYGRLRR